MSYTYNIRSCLLYSVKSFYLMYYFFLHLQSQNFLTVTLALFDSDAYSNLFLHRFLTCLISSAMGSSSSGNLFDHWVFFTQMHLQKTKLPVRLTFQQDKYFMRFFFFPPSVGVCYIKYMHCLFMFSCIKAFQSPTRYLSFLKSGIMILQLLLGCMI